MVCLTTTTNNFPFLYVIIGMQMYAKKGNLNYHQQIIIYICMQERYANTPNQTLNVCKKGMQKRVWCKKNVCICTRLCKKGYIYMQKKVCKKAEPYAKVAYAKKGMQKRAHSS